ncbi:unnamed protein product, partial [marine sediment metagenome]
KEVTIICTGNVGHVNGSLGKLFVLLDRKLRKSASLGTHSA